MWSALAWLFGLGGVAASVLYWLKGLLSSKGTLDETSSALRVERSRLDVMDKAAAHDRAQRAEVLDGKIASASSPADTAALLRQATGADRT